MNDTFQTIFFIVISLNLFEFHPKHIALEYGCQRDMSRQTCGGQQQRAVPVDGAIDQYSV